MLDRMLVIQNADSADAATVFEPALGAARHRRRRRRHRRRRRRHRQGRCRICVVIVIIIVVFPQRPEGTFVVRTAGGKISRQRRRRHTVFAVDAAVAIRRRRRPSRRRRRRHRRRRLSGVRRCRRSYFTDNVAESDPFLFGGVADDRAALLTDAQQPHVIRAPQRRHGTTGYIVADQTVAPVDAVIQAAVVVVYGTAVTRIR